MDLLVTLIIGALIGWIASLIMGTNSQQGTILNIIVGAVGAFLSRLVFGNLLGINSAAIAGTFSFWGIVWGVLGAALLIVLLKAFRILH